MWRGLGLCLCLCLLWVLLPFGPREGRAAEDGPRLMIALREADERRRRYEPQGAYLGAIRLDAAAEQRFVWDDNVFAEADGGSGDVLTTTAADLALRREGAWALDLTAGLALTRYGGESALDHENYRVGAAVAGRSWDRSRLDLSAAYHRLHEQPGAPDLFGAPAEPVPVDRLQGTGELLLRRGIFFTGATTALRRLDFHDVPDRRGGVLDEDGRDRWEMTSALRLGIAPAPTVDVFAEHRLDTVTHDKAGLFSRDWTTRLLLGGVAVDFSERLVGEVGAGTMRVRWAMPGIAPLTKPVVRAAVAFSVTPLMTLRGRVWRKLEASPNLAGFGVLSDGGRVRVEHELLRNLRLSAEAEVTRRSWLGPGATRRDDGLLIGAGGEWRFDARWYSGVQVTREERASTEPEAEFERLRIMLRVGARL